MQISVWITLFVNHCPMDRVDQHFNNLCACVYFLNTLLLVDTIDIGFSLVDFNEVDGRNNWLFKFWCLKDYKYWLAPSTNICPTFPHCACHAQSCLTHLPDLSNPAGYDRWPVWLFYTYESGRLQLYISLLREGFLLFYLLFCDVGYPIIYPIVTFTFRKMKNYPIKTSNVHSRTELPCMANISTVHEQILLKL